MFVPLGEGGGREKIDLNLNYL